MKLERSFYTREILTVSRELIGKNLVHHTAEGITKGRIVEVEAYVGAVDKASHAYGNKCTGRTAIQYSVGGFAYVYLIYGMYDCMNIVTGQEGLAEAILIRALEPVEGIELMRKRRHTTALKNLCSGPGKLCMAMGITRECYGLDLCGDELYLEQGSVSVKPDEISATKRINIDYAEEARDFPWRFILTGSPFLSVKG
ncbi:MAG: DNA-3-methyladenine glycosylase [Verrucomicrobia bacterium]|nr:DNA-3-methyladenine glycosylase [Verrucomicrobiota bacterium]